MCHTTVVDKSGHLITDLPESAFTVYEDGVKQPIKVFKREDVPVSIGLVIDNSGSMRDKRAKVAAAALALVKASNKDDESFVVNFNDEAFLDLPHNKEFTNDLSELEEALSRIDARGGTAMRDAIRMSIDWVKEKGHRDKKVLVVVTDGNDNSSVISLENLVKAAQQAGVLIYSVGLLSEEERREAQKAKRALLDLAEATGGEAFFPKELSEVDRIAGQVARDIRSQYTIAYTPGNDTMDGKFRVDQNRRQCARQADRPHPQRLLRHARPGPAFHHQNLRREVNAARPVAPDPRLPPAAVAQPVPALAHRDLLGLARGQHHVRPVLVFRLEAAAGIAAISPLGGAAATRPSRAARSTAGMPAEQRGTGH